MKTIIIKNHCYPTSKSDSSDTYDFAIFSLTSEFLLFINDAIALAQRENDASLRKHHAADSPRLNPILRGHTYSDKGRLTYFNRNTIERLISLQGFDEAEDTHIEAIHGELPKSIDEEALYTDGATLEIWGSANAFRWHNKPRYDGEIILLTDWIYLDNEHLQLEDESTQSDDGDLYFKSKAARIIFALTHLSGDELCEELKITKRHYYKRNRKMADEWYESLAQIINPATCNHPDAKRAFAKLKEIYGNMTSY